MNRIVWRAADRSPWLSRAAAAWSLGLCALALLPAGPAGAQGFVTASQFAVTESGAATLSIPIQVPRGIGGMEPQLSLNYSSGAGNGLLGVGWTLQGPSAVTRCPRSIPIDGVRGTVRFDANDRYCLDGQRLVKVDPAAPNAATTPALLAAAQSGYGGAGTEYRTERDSFSRITAIGTYGSQTTVPRGFKVETKSGLILEFGNTQNTTMVDSQVLTKFSTAASGATQTINRWMLRRMSDRHGNWVDFVYCGGDVTPLATAEPMGLSDLTSECSSSAVGVSHPLHYIRYTNRGSTANGTFGVVFRYAARPDTMESFHAGNRARQSTRMVAIQTFVGFSGPGTPGTLVKTYDLFYEPIETGTVSQRATPVSRLAAVQEREPGGTTLPKLAFTYAPDLVFGKPVQHRAGTTSGLPPPPACGGVTLNKQSQMCP